MSRRSYREGPKNRELPRGGKWGLCKAKPNDSGWISQRAVARRFACDQLTIARLIHHHVSDSVDDIQRPERETATTEVPDQYIQMAHIQPQNRVQMIQTVHDASQYTGIVDV